MLKKVILSLLLLYTAIGFILLPIILKPQIEKIANEELNAKLSIQNIYINPFIFKFRLDGVKLKDLEDKELVSFKSLFIDIELYSLFNSAVHLKKLSLDDAKVSLIHNKDKTFNLASILKAKEDKTLHEEPKADTKLPRIIIDTIALKNASIDYEDFTGAKKFDFSLDRLSFKLKDIDTNDFESSAGKFRFHTLLGDSGVLDIRTDIIALKPLKIKGNIDFKMAKLYKELDYIEDKIGVEVANGGVYLHANYTSNLDDLNSTLIDNLTLSLKDLRVKPKLQHHDVLNLKIFEVSNVSIKPFAKEVHVPKTVLNNLSIKAIRAKNGDIDWVNWFKLENKSKPKKELANKDKIKNNDKKWKVVLDSIKLEKIALNIDDKTIKPNVTSKINELNLELKDVTLLGKKAFSYNLNMLINDKIKCNSNGDIKHNILELNSYMKCDGIDLIHYKPYIDDIALKQLKTYDISLLGLNTAFDFNLYMREQNNTLNTKITKANLKIMDFKLNKKSTQENLVNFKSFDINDVSLDTKTKEISISKVALNSFSLNVKKDKKGNLNLDGLVEAKEKKTKKKTLITSKKTKKEKDFHIILKHFNINNTKVNFLDQSIATTTNSKIDKITLDAYDIDSKKNTWLKYKSFMRINEKGDISSNGKLRLSSLNYKGEVKVNKISLKEITPYLQESMYLNLDDGFLSVNSKINYEKSKNKPDLNIDGSVSLESFELSDSRTKETLLTFAKTDLKSFNLKLFPSSMYIDEVVLDSFYVDAQIDENKQINFSKLTKVSKNEKSLDNTPKDTNTNEENSFAFKLMKLNVKNGTANFADESLPIKFKTSMHNLNGNVYAISNSKGEISYIDIDGEVDKYGSTKIKGSIDSSNIKSYTDIGVNFRNLALDSYSGYSAQFAGYKIDKGKLFLDLEYKIIDSQLLGKNSLIIKQIELGDEIEDKNITKLPLGFAIALLEDSDGIIDINMPVEGDLNDPDFKYGALILKTFVNLIIKAVASPFSFLGSMLGINGDDLKTLDFEVAKTNIMPPEREKLDNIAKMLIKKPKLSFAIIASYDEAKDTLALQKQKLTNDILKRSDNKQNVAMTASILENIYQESLGKDNLVKLKNSFRKKYEKDEVFKVKYEEELLNKVIKTKKISTKELEDLANKRASTLQQYLVQSKNIKDSRVVIEAIKSIKEEDTEFVKTELKIIVK